MATVVNNPKSQSFITRTDNMKRLFADLRKYKQIDKEEETRLASIIQKGGKAGERAKEQLVMSNGWFVVSVANKYANRGMELDDLYNEGFIGMCKAADIFDPEKGKFIAIAESYIKQAILDALADKMRAVRLPQNSQRRLRQYRKMCADYQQKYGRDCTVSEFCDFYGYDEHKLRRILFAAEPYTMLDAQLVGCHGDDSETTYIDMMQSDSRADRALDEESRHDDLMRVINKVLTPKEREVVTMHYGLEGTSCNIHETATNLGLAYENTRLTLRNAEKKLRSYYLAA